MRVRDSDEYNYIFSTAQARTYTDNAPTHLGAYRDIQVYESCETRGNFNY